MKTITKLKRKVKLASAKHDKALSDLVKSTGTPGQKKCLETFSSVRQDYYKLITKYVKLITNIR